MSTFFFVVASRRVWGLVENDLKYFCVVCILICLKNTIYICKILSSLTFSLQSCIWLKSLKVDQKNVGNGTPQPIYFLSFSVRSLLFFLPTLVFDGVFFCPNTHGIWTPVRSCCSRMWSGSEAHKLMNITFYFFNCHPTQIFFWQINQGRRLVHDSLT